MIRNLKVLGLALAAVFAFSAIASSSAMATPEVKCLEGQTHCVAKAEQEGSQVFVTQSGSTTCTNVSGEGTIGTAMQVTAEKISYTGCTTQTIFGKIPVTVSFNGCDYLFTTSTAPVHLVCPAGKEVTIVGPGCEIKVPGGQTLEQVHYINAGSGSTMDVTIEATVKNIKSSSTGGFCTKNGTFTDGSYTGNVTLTGEKTTGGHVGITNE